jgi:type IV secretory pathway VirB6-like protein
MLNKTLLLFCILVGGYAYSVPFPRCIPADYFGPKPVTVKAGYSKDETKAFLSNKKETAAKKPGSDDQVVRWENTGLVTNGKDLIIRVQGAWTAWNKNNAKESKHDILKLEELERIRYKGIENKDHKEVLPAWDDKCIMKPTQQDGSSNCYSIDEHKSKIPCWFTNGEGAYLLFKSRSDPDPNETLEYMRNPISPVVHMGGQNMKDGTLHIGIGKSQDQGSQYSHLDLSEGMEIYVKILDRYYFNNMGGYSLEVLSGASGNSSQIFNDIYEFLKKLLLIDKNTNDVNKSAAREMFNNIIHKGGNFKRLAVTLLCLFIVISALLYIFGMVRDVYRDFIFRVMKVALVVMLLSTDSFKFFYDHFFGAFIYGLEYLIETVSVVSKNARSSVTFDFMDDMFWTFTSYATLRKIVALLLSQLPGSIVFVLCIFLAIVVYLILCISFFIVFLTGFIGIAFLIAIMPLFLLSILFSPLKHLFEGWLKYLVSLCLKSVMLYTLLGLFYSIIMDSFYRQLGFTVCYNQWLVVCIPKGIPFIGGKCPIDISTWTAGQVFKPYTPIASPAKLADQEAEKLSGRFKFTGGKSKMRVPPDYKEKEEERYIDYPFYETSETSKSDDGDDMHNIARIDDIQNGYLINLLEVFIMVLLSFLMYALRNIVEELSANFAGGGFSMNNVQAIYDTDRPLSLKEYIKSPVKLVHAPIKFLQAGVLSGISEGSKVIREFPDKFAGGAAKLVGRAPLIGGILETGINASRKLVKAAALTTQIITTPHDKVKHFEDRIFDIFGIDKTYLSSNNKYSKYLDYYRKSVGAHLGYVLGAGFYGDGDNKQYHIGYAFKDAIKFGSKHNIRSLECGGAHRSNLSKDGPNDRHVKNPFYMAYLCRKDFMKKLRDSTIGVEANTVQRRRRNMIEKEKKRRDREEEGGNE